MTDDARSALLDILARLSFRLGQFTLSSGATSDYYIDCRTTTLHAEGARLTGLAILDLLREHKLRPAAVGGLTLGADPVVSAVAIASAMRAQEYGAAAAPQLRERLEDDPPSPLIHGFLVRKAEKTHGTGRRIEGFLDPGAPVVIVDDVCTTGASTIAAIEAARETGMKVIAAVCLVEREEAGGRPALEAALQAGVPGDPTRRGTERPPFLRLFTANDVRAAHIRQNPGR